MKIEENKNPKKWEVMFTLYHVQSIHELVREVKKWERREKIKKLYEDQKLQEQSD